MGSGGAGHKATARALVEACRLAKKDFDIEVVDVAGILGMRASFGDGVYNWLLASGRASWIPTLHTVATTLTNLNERSLTDLFRVALEPRHCDMVVSCCPFVNVCIAEAVSAYARRSYTRARVGWASVR